MTATIVLDHVIKATSCVKVAIKGYSVTGLCSTTFEEVVGCRADGTGTPPVFDAHGPINEDGSVG